MLSNGILNRINDAITSILGTLTVGLFKNDATITRATVLSDLTECDFDGYTRLVLGGAGGSAQSGGISTAAYSFPPTFTKSGTVENDVYGYFILDGALNFVGAEKDPDAPIPMHTDGSTYTVSLSASFKGQYPLPTP